MNVDRLIERLFEDTDEAGLACTSCAFNHTWGEMHDYGERRVLEATRECTAPNPKVCPAVRNVLEQALQKVA